LRLLALPAYDAQYRSLSKRLRRTCYDAGIRLDIVPGATTAEVVAKIADEDFDIVAFRWLAYYPDTDGMVATLLHSAEGTLGGFCGTPEVDRLIEAGRRESDPALRHAIYRQIEETIVREALLIPLFHKQAYRFCRPGVEGLRLTLGGSEVRYDELSVKR
jgi:ABC-type transport system substrate-binding protein